LDRIRTKRVEVGSGVNPCVTAYSNLPFGDGSATAAVSTYSQCPEDATEHHFTGKERDDESGNDYFEARYYASSMGRFMSPDWSAKEDPVPYAKVLCTLIWGAFPATLAGMGGQMRSGKAS